jgi:hypothetical protein
VFFFFRLNRSLSIHCRIQFHSLWFKWLRNEFKSLTLDLKCVFWRCTYFSSFFNYFMKYYLKIWFYIVWFPNCLILNSLVTKLFDFKQFGFQTCYFMWYFYFPQKNRNFKINCKISIFSLNIMKIKNFWTQVITTFCRSRWAYS